MIKPTPLIRSSCQRTANLAGSFRLVEYKAFTGNSVSFTGLDGDSDILYKLTGMLVANTDTYPVLTLNGDTGANYHHTNAVLGATYSSSAVNDNTDYELIGTSLAAGDSLFFEICIAAADISKSHVISCRLADNSSNEGVLYQTTGEYADTSAITSIQIFSGVSESSGTFASGSFIQLAKMAVL